ncbi:MAG TPA: GAF domain-containing protein [Flavobacteriales bacterium]|nr:GAF domain-containing protein [Flavobacteriales bacterium]
MNSKKELYSELVPKVSALIDKEANIIANLANIAAILKAELSCLWVGFYLVEGKELVVGPFQGPVACTTIAFGRGVCGKCWELKETILVDDVSQFADHIACSADSKSEIVVPVFDSNNNVQMVLDIDSSHLAAFDEEDKSGLEAIATLITALL